MTTKEFGARSSDGVSTYAVIVEWDGSALHVTCDCRAGELGGWCRHKDGLLKGDNKILVVDDDLTEILQWVKASPIHSAMSDIDAAAAQQKEAEAVLKKAKERVAALRRVLADLVSPVRQGKR